MAKSIWYISKYAGAPNEHLGRARLFNFAKYFADQGNSVKLISSQSNGSKEVSKQKELFTSFYYDGLEYVQLKGPKIQLGFSLKRIFSWIIFEMNLRRYFKKQREFPDVVIVSSLSLLTILNGLYLKKKHNTKFILEIRDIWPLSLIELSSLGPNNPFVLILKWFEMKAYKGADKIIGTMPNLQEHIETIIGPANKVSCIPMAFHPKEYETQHHLPDDLINKIPSDHFIVGYAGSIGNANAMETLLDSAKYIQDQQMTIVILGDGPLLQTYKKKYVGEQIVFLGKTEKEKVQHFLSFCDVLVNTWHDSKIYKYGISPNKWIDYMYAAKPIIVAYNGYKSIINEANCGEFIEAKNSKKLAEKIIAYSKKPKQELIDMGLRGKSFLENHLTYEKLGDRYLSIIEEA